MLADDDRGPDRRGSCDRLYRLLHRGVAVDDALPDAWSVRLATLTAAVPHVPAAGEYLDDLGRALSGEVA
jgi:hypothetical protein